MLKRENDCKVPESLNENSGPVFRNLTTVSVTIVV